MKYESDKFDICDCKYGEINTKKFFLGGGGERDD